MSMTSLQERGEEQHNFGWATQFWIIDYFLLIHRTIKTNDIDLSMYYLRYVVFFS